MIKKFNSIGLKKEPKDTLVVVAMSGGVDSSIIFDKVVLEDKQLIAREKLIEQLIIEDGEVLLTMGAGDIDAMVEPIKVMLDNRVSGTG